MNSRRVFNWSWALVGLFGANAMQGQEPPAPTVADSVRMMRIQHSVESRRPLADVAVLSPDGQRVACVLWRGDLERNTNRYSLTVLRRGGAGLEFRPEPALLTWEFAGDPNDQHASAFMALKFLADGRTLAFIGQRDGEVAQAYTVHVDSGALKQLTHHPTPVRAFAVGAEGGLFYAALAESSIAVERRDRLEQDGVFLWENALFSRGQPGIASPALHTEDRRWIWQFFFERHGVRRQVFDSEQNRIPAPERDHTINADNQGRYALIFPYSPEVASPPSATEHAYGLVDLSDGNIEPLSSATHPPLGSFPTWSPDGKSVVIFAKAQPHLSNPAQWMEIDIATRNITPLPVPTAWKVARFAADGDSVLFFDKRRGYARASRIPSGGWGALETLGFPGEFNLRWQPVTDGRIAIGVVDGMATPPELAAIDLGARQVVVLTDLNPELRRRTFGKAEPFSWSHRFADATGFLIKPVNYLPGVRYPLVVLFDDGAILSDERSPYLLDGFTQLNGHAAQMLANSGFMVFVAMEFPGLLAAGSDGSSEGERVCVHIETALAKLDEAGLIDPKRVGVSGWSRAAYHVDQLLIKSSFRFAAASRMDGGGVDYKPSFRPYRDEELRRIHAPLLIEPHGILSLVFMTAMADRLEAWGKPTETLYFHAASHSTVRPQHRLRSLDTHVDWWKFWLKDEEDPDPAKVDQFQHWRALRAMRDADLKSATPALAKDSSPPASARSADSPR